MNFVFLISALLGCSLASPLFDSAGNFRTVHVEQAENGIFDHSLYSEPINEPLPEVLNLRLVDQGRELYLSLRKSKHIPTVSLTPTGSFEHDISQIQNAAVYTDSSSGASLVVRKHETDSGKYQLDGTLLLGLKEVLVKPAARTKRNSGNGDNPHDVIPLHSNDIIFGQDFVEMPKVKTVDGVSGSKRSKRQTSADKHTVQIYFVADNSDFEGWKSAYPDESVQQVKDRMTLYYTGLAESIKFRYQTVADIPLTPRLEIDIEPLGLLIIEDAVDSPWITELVMANGNINGSDALNIFQHWLETQTKFRLPSADHFMTFTRKNIEGTSGAGAVGLANKGALCTPNAVSIVENSVSGLTAGIAAHELGHSLNADHDGFNDSVACSGDERYLMASILSFPKTETTRQRPWTFSNCSVKTFQQFLDTVSCTKNHASSVSPSIHLGQKVNGDEQCQLALKTNMCRALYDNSTYHTLCYGMWCYKPGAQGSCTKIFPHEYTSCGNQKWCVKGMCVFDKKAPAVYDDCPQGDQTGYNCTTDLCKRLTPTQQKRFCCATCNEKPTTAAPSTTPTTTPTTATTTPTTKLTTTPTTVTTKPTTQTTTPTTTELTTTTTATTTTTPDAKQETGRQSQEQNGGRTGTVNQPSNMAYWCRMYRRHGLCRICSYSQLLKRWCRYCRCRAQNTWDWRWMMFLD